MESFGSIECFVRSAEGGSFAEAARHLSLTPAAVGKSVAKLEARLGVRLFQRSTRRLTLTEAGKLFLEEVSGSLTTIQNAVANLASAEGRPVGTLKVSMGTVFGNRYVVPLLGEFLKRFPDINPDWHFDNRQVDLIGQGFDAAIGGGFELPQGVVARKLAPAHRILLASPEYLAKRKPVVVPEDLSVCNGILIRSPQTGRVRSWQLTHRTREQRPLVLKPRMTMSDSGAACCASAQGLGIALVSMPMAVPYLDSGQLVRVLPDWYVDDGNISLYYAEHKLLPGKTRAFVDFILEQFVERELGRRFSAI
ncbi:MAG: LysR family transcriptional regulator [Pseudomonas sp.]|jgi:DNA-binding transcriptional LysR family regulator|uniref:LysR family transcriptional regulator n=1 Tax=unclassified Pseudomonas TaxID=196821 RepID=UPI000272CAF3|nr:MULTISPECIES: LysR family transcriptional regulator [unclassified Pseudomonas]MDP9061878.1 LysR family transcriptional regulator [Pseudomonadota bacterium]AUO21965.1 LysR family transcriptional regulator [Pseudomonas sp. NC02]EJF72576.1 LysR family transcriptional regulator [Pseudomonas sp. Ag1]MDE1913251.1 LysR family transcriptional regulator [Pseudomonas sp.]MDE2193108.1 LysR family transcriptional regulator [Pseudomonas sp.]|eukprot:gene1050-1192_t